MAPNTSAILSSAGTVPKLRKPVGSCRHVVSSIAKVIASTTKIQTAATLTNITPFECNVMTGASVSAALITISMMMAIIVGLEEQKCGQRG